MPPETRENGLLIEWDPARAFGFIQVGNRRLFVHRRAFDRFADPPELGDTIVFSRGADAQGRPCAVEAAVLRRSGRRWNVLVLLVPLCTLPLAAILRGRWPVLWVLGGLLLLNLLTFFAYRFDKKSALQRVRRTEEVLLHFLELLGGWPAAFVAQRVLRHKVSKARYQAIFWIIVALHQLAALDSLLDWRGLKAGVALIRQGTAARR